MWLIVVGFILIGIAFYYYTQNEEGQRANSTAPKPTPGLNSAFYGLLGFAALVGAVWTLYEFFKFREVGWALFCLVLFIIFLWVCRHLSKASYEAEKKDAENMAFRRIAEQERHTYKTAGRKEDINMAVMEENARTQIAKNKADQEREKNWRFEEEQRAVLIGIAAGYGITADQLTSLNYQQIQAKIDLAKRRAEKAIDREHEYETAQDVLRAADTSEHYKIINQLEDQLEELQEKRRKTEKTEKDKKLRQQKIQELDRRIQHLKDDINVRQENRLLSTQNRKDPHRLKEWHSDL